ncbi:hypothetical protein N9W84_00560 [bacterium]|nr:hypothetical protein [bacterium]
MANGISHYKISWEKKMTLGELYSMIPVWVEKDKTKWNHLTLLAYFCHKYQKKHGVRFIFASWKGDLAKTKECKDISKVYKKFLHESYPSLKGQAKKDERFRVICKVYNYINWMFDYKFRSGERSVTGTKIFQTPSMINEFERQYSAYLNKKQRASGINSFKSFVSSEYPEIYNSHQFDDANDIKIFKRYVEGYNLDKSSDHYKVIFKAKQMGLI